MTIIKHDNTDAVVQRSSKQKVSEKFSKFLGNDLCQNVFFNKAAGLRSATLFKMDSNTGVFLGILRNF